YISRYLSFSVPFAPTSIVRFILNAIEDPRVNTWVRRRYPGTAPWLQRVADLDMQTVESSPMPSILRFGYEAAREEWRGWAPANPEDGVPGDVVQALAETREARRQYAEILPPPDLNFAMMGAGLAQRYREEVWPHLTRNALRVLPSPREQGVRL